MKNDATLSQMALNESLQRLKRMEAFPYILMAVLTIATSQAYAYERTIYIPRSVTIHSNQYTISKPNMEALTAIKSAGVKLYVGQFTPATGDDGSIMCRGWFPIAPKRGVSFSEFLKSALTSELTEAGIYSETEGTELSIQIEEIDFTSAFSGMWKFRVRIATAKKEAAVFTFERSFENSYAAAAACASVGAAFVPSVQEFLNSIYSNQKFLDLFTE